jgi:hypothetical protein
MPRAAHPMKEEVILWLARQHNKSPYPGIHSAVEAAREHFKGQELPATLRQWAAEAIDYQPRARRARGGAKVEDKETFTFESALQQIEAIKGKMIQGLKNQYRQILAQEREIEAERQKLNEAVEKCARITGVSEADINRELESVQA